MNLILPVAIGLMTAFAVAISSAGSASAFFANIWEKHPILIAIAAAAAAVAGLVTIISTLASAAETAEEKFTKANEAISKSQQRIAELKSVQSNATKMFEWGRLLRVVSTLWGVVH